MLIRSFQRQQGQRLFLASAMSAAAGLPGTRYPFTAATLPAPWDQMRRAGLGTRVQADGAVAFGPESYGANVVVNGDFATDTVWSKGAGWAISGGLATKTPGVQSNLTQACLVVNTAYIVTGTVSGRTAGALNVYLGSGFAFVAITANGSFTVSGVCVGSTTLFLQGTSSFDGSIDNVSAREITYLPRPTHDPSTLAALGLLIEGQAANKSTNRKINPTDATNVLTINGAVVSVVNRAAELAAAGLSAVCTNGLVYQASNPGASDAYAYAVGVAGNLNRHCVSGWLMGTGWLSEGFGGGQLAPIPSATAFTYLSASFIPPNANSAWAVRIPPGATVWWIANQLEEGPTATSPIIDSQTATVLRTGDFAGGGLSGAALTALLTPTQPFTIVFPFRKAYTQAAVETLLGLCAGSSAGGTNQFGIATNGTQAQIIHSGGSGALTGTLSTTAVNRIAVGVDPTWRGPELVTNGGFDSGAAGWSPETSGVLSASAGILRITNSGGANGRAFQAITTTVGRIYEVTVVATNRSAGATYEATVRGAGSFGLTYGTTGVQTAAGTYRLFFQAALTSHTVCVFAIGADGQWAEWDSVSVREVGAVSVAVNGSTPVETTGIAYTGAGVTNLVLGARDTAGGQPAVAVTIPELRVVPGQYITGTALQALSQ
jgi:hypothetical protein